jgi:hypothetical protein
MKEHFRLAEYGQPPAAALDCAPSAATVTASATAAQPPAPATATATATAAQPPAPVPVSKGVGKQAPAAPRAKASKPKRGKAATKRVVEKKQQDTVNTPAPSGISAISTQMVGPLQGNKKAESESVAVAASAAIAPAPAAAQPAAAQPAAKPPAATRPSTAAGPISAVPPAVPLLSVLPMVPNQHTHTDTTTDDLVEHIDECLQKGREKPLSESQRYLIDVVCLRYAIFRDSCCVTDRREEERREQC